MRIPYTILLSTLSFGLAACGSSSTAVSAFDDLSISSSNDGAYIKPINLNYPMQTHFLSVNGQLPVPDVGISCFASSYRAANSMICLSPTGSTHVLTRTYKSDATLADLLKIKKSLATLQADMFSLVAASGGQPASLTSPKAKEIASEVAKLDEVMKKKNVFVFRWTKEVNTNANGNIGTTASATSGGNHKATGLVIVAGLRVSQLMVGVDDLNNKFGNLPKTAKVATLTMAADHLVYFASSDFSAALDVNANGNFGDKFTNLPAETKMAMNAFLAIGSNQDTQGMFSAPDSVSTEGLYESYAQSLTKQIFYATMTDIETLIKSVSAQ